MRHAKLNKLSAFTLVELLVVIGIIALLISILLPSLNRARALANSVDCMSRLHQIGEMLVIYEANNKGLMPWGVIDRAGIESAPGVAAPTYPNPNPAEFWFWYDELASMANKNLVFNNSNSHCMNLPPVFNDRDSIDTPDGTTPEVYTGNPRVFWQNTDLDMSTGNPNGSSGTDGNFVPQYRASRLGSGSAFIVWDAPQIADGFDDGCAYPIGVELDGNRLEFGHCFDTFNAPQPPEVYGRPVSPGLPSQSTVASILKSKQIQYNYDLPTYSTFVHLRFRHMKNTSMNALCGDGHVTSRIVGSAMLNDFIVGYPY